LNIAEILPDGGTSSSENFKMRARPKGIAFSFWDRISEVGNLFWGIEFAAGFSCLGGKIADQISVDSLLIFSKFPNI
jgi:hypothetical protein